MEHGDQLGRPLPAALEVRAERGRLVGSEHGQDPFAPGALGPGPLGGHRQQPVDGDEEEGRAEHHLTGEEEGSGDQLDDRDGDGRGRRRAEDRPIRPQRSYGALSGRPMT